MLEPALRSVLDQTYQNLEIVFVDNNSDDGSLERAREIAARSARRIQITRCEEQGANRARNHGYELARGDYVQWLDADDWLGRDKIERQVALLEEDGRCCIAYCDWLSRRHVGKARPIETLFPLADVDDQIERILAQIWYPLHAYLIRRDAAERLQQERGWWPDRRVGTDVEYSALAALLGQSFRHVKGALVGYNTWSKTQISGRDTPYTLRAASFRDIYRRLKELTKRPDVAPRITAQHRLLLNQDWNVWSLPRDSVDLTRGKGRKITVRNRATGRTANLRPREAEFIEAMIRAGPELAIAHLALVIAARPPYHPYRSDELVQIVETLENLRRCGILTMVTALEPAFGGDGPKA